MRNHFRSLMVHCLGGLLPVFVVLAQLAVPVAKGAATIWTGPHTTFTKADSTDPTQAANQDRLTANVWLTRASSEGIYNAKTETGFTHFFSPADTEWATGTTTNVFSLTYTDWNTWAKILNGGPPDTVGTNAVLHLISDDIYIDIKFTSWSVVNGGGFAYERSTPTLPPTPQLLSVQLTGGNFGMSFVTVSSQSYTVQANLGLMTTNWFNCTNITGNGLLTLVTVPISNGVPQEFFRVKQP